MVFLIPFVLFMYAVIDSNNILKMFIADWLIIDGTLNDLFILIIY